MRIVPASLIMVLSWTLIATLPSFAQDNATRPGDGQSDAENRPTSQPTAPATDGLRLSIEVTETQHPDAVVFRVSIENVGEDDALLNLGEMLGNGNVLLPDAIRLTLTDSAGESRELRFSDREHPGVAGRVDDYILPLRSGSVHTLRLSLVDYWSPDTQEFRIELKPGTYSVRAAFTGTGAQALNSDTEGLRLMHFWTGRLESPAARFQIGEEK